MQTDRDLYHAIRASRLYRPEDLERVFLLARTREGKTSYDVLAATPSLAWHGCIVDLAAGTGAMAEACTGRLASGAELYLIDFSPEELNVARHKPCLRQARFLEESAQKLSLRDDSVDVMFCHLAAMVFDPLAPALREIGRVLRAGGMFVFNILSPGTQTASVEFFRICKEYEKQIPNFEGWGDARATSKDQFSSALLECAQAEVLEWQAYTVFYSGAPLSIFEDLKPFFQIHYFLPEPLRKSLRNEFMERCATSLPHGGIMEFELPLIRGVAVKKR